MPLFFKLSKQLIFMPGEDALYKPDKDTSALECTVHNFLSDENNVIQGYSITLKSNPNTLMACDISQIFPLPTNTKKKQ